MTFLKNLTVSLFSFFLFLALSIFGFAFTLKSTALNPDFITTALNRLEIAALAEEMINLNPPAELPDLNKMAQQALTRLEPDIKKQAGSAIYSIYDYLLGKTNEPHLAQTLRSTFLSSDFVTPLLDSIDIAPLAGAFLEQQLASSIPVEIPDLNKYIEEILAGKEPAMKQEILTASGPVFDYLLGIKPTLTASVSLKTITGDMKDTLRRIFLDSPPPELAAIPREQRQSYFDLFYDEFAAMLPADYRIDESLITPEMRDNFTDGIAAAEDALAEAKPYVNYFQQGYTLLLVFMAVMALGIILLVRNIKDITHQLGIPMLTYGAIEYGGIWVVKYLMSSGRLKLPDEIPAPLQTWITQLSYDIMKPLEIFSLALLIIGLALTIVSFLYKHDQDLKWS